MPPKGSDLVFDHRHNADMSTLVVRIYIYAFIGILNRDLGLADDRRAVFPSFGREIRRLLAADSCRGARTASPAAPANGWVREPGRQPAAMRWCRGWVAGWPAIGSGELLLAGLYFAG